MSAIDHDSQNPALLAVQVELPYLPCGGHRGDRQLCHSLNNSIKALCQAEMASWLTDKVSFLKLTSVMERLW